MLLRACNSKWWYVRYLESFWLLNANKSGRNSRCACSFSSIFLSWYAAILDKTLLTLPTYSVTDLAIFRELANICCFICLSFSSLQGSSKFSCIVSSLSFFFLLMKFSWKSFSNDLHLKGHELQKNFFL